MPVLLIYSNDFYGVAINNAQSFFDQVKLEPIGKFGWYNWGKSAHVVMRRLWVKAMGSDVNCSLPPVTSINDFAEQMKTTSITIASD